MYDVLAHQASQQGALIFEEASVAIDAEGDTSELSDATAASPQQPSAPSDAAALDDIAEGGAAREPGHGVRVASALAAVCGLVLCCLARRGRRAVGGEAVQTEASRQADEAKVAEERLVEERLASEARLVEEQRRTIVELSARLAGESARLAGESATRAERLSLEHRLELDALAAARASSATAHRTHQATIIQQKAEIDALAVQLAQAQTAPLRTDGVARPPSPEAWSEEVESLRAHLELLKAQLKKAGVLAIDEVVSFAEAKEKLRAAVQKIMAGDSDFSAQDEKDLTKWDEFVRCHPEHEREQTAEVEGWRSAQQAANAAARLVVRGHVPPSIWSQGLSLPELRRAGLGDAVAQRIFKNPVLWLTRASPSRVAKTHVADLRGRYHFGPSLSLLELRAVLASISPDAFDGNDTPRGDKRAWRQGLEDKLREKLTQGNAANPACYGASAQWAAAVAAGAPAATEAEILDAMPFGRAKDEAEPDYDKEDAATKAPPPPALLRRSRTTPLAAASSASSSAPVIFDEAAVRKAPRAADAGDAENAESARRTTPTRLRRTKSLAYPPAKHSGSPRSALAALILNHPLRRVD